MSPIPRPPHSPDPAGAPSSGAAGLTIDELEAATGVPARTIRFYRQSGLIESPRRVGRQAFYDADQVRRLRLIAALRDRGLALDAVSKILADPAGEHRSFSSLLEVRDELLAPWIDDRSLELTEHELLDLLHTRQRDVIDELVTYGIVETGREAGEFHVPSLATLELAVELAIAGVQPNVAAASWAAMTGRLAGLADELVSIFVDHAGYGFPGAGTTDAAIGSLRQLRPIALRAVQLAFAHEIERAIGTYVDGAAPSGVSSDSTT